CGGRAGGEWVMEQQAVGEIFGQGANEITRRGGAKEGSGIVSSQTQAREDENKRQIDKQWCGPVDARQFVKQGVFEKPRRRAQACRLMRGSAPGIVCRWRHSRPILLSCGPN